LAATLELVIGNGQVTTREFAESKRIGLNTSGTRLLNLYKKRFVARIEDTTEEGGRQYVYKSLIFK
jgi:predicted transcriptional regulator